MIDAHCWTCYDIGFYPHKYNGDHYPKRLCVCDAAAKMQYEMRYREKLGTNLLGSYYLHETKAVRYRDSGPYFWCDLGIEDDTRLLWSEGIGTRNSCEGGKNSVRYIQLARPEDMARAMELLAWTDHTERSDRPRAIYGRVPWTMSFG